MDTENYLFNKIFVYLIIYLELVDVINCIIFEVWVGGLECL